MLLKPTNNRDDWLVLQDRLRAAGHCAADAIDDAQVWAETLKLDEFGLAAKLPLGRKCWMRWIVPGRFMMGSVDGPVEERPAHLVEVSEGFWLGDTPVNCALWDDVMPGRSRVPVRPVNDVSWNDTHVFMERLEDHIGGAWRLPTEVEWEYACRAGTTTATWAMDFSPDATVAPGLKSIAWYADSFGPSARSTWPPISVGLLEPNPFGLYDMLGNVAELCFDRFARTYRDSASRGERRSAGGSGSREPERPVTRGGAWDSAAWQVRAAARGTTTASARSDTVGFRLALGGASLRAQTTAQSAQRLRPPTTEERTGPEVEVCDPEKRTPWGLVFSNPPSPAMGRWDFEILVENSWLSRATVLSHLGTNANASRASRDAARARASSAESAARESDPDT